MVFLENDALTPSRRPNPRCTRRRQKCAGLGLILDARRGRKYARTWSWMDSLQGLIHRHFCASGSRNPAVVRNSLPPKVLPMSAGSFNVVLSRLLTSSPEGDPDINYGKPRIPSAALTSSHSTGPVGRLSSSSSLLGNETLAGATGVSVEGQRRRFIRDKWDGRLSVSRVRGPGEEHLLGQSN